MPNQKQLIEKADAHRQAGRLSHAVRLLQQALKSAPTEVELLKRLGQITWQQKQYPESLAYFQQATEIEPDSAGLQANLGALLHKLGQLESAEAALQRAVQLDPDSAVAHDNLGVVLNQRGHPQQALEHHRKALAIDADYIMAHANLGVALENTGGREEAMDAFKTATALDDTLAFAHCGLGRLYLARGNFEQAEAACRTALALEPDNVAGISGLAQVLQNLGNTGEAVKLHRQALRKAPQRPDLKLNLATALMAAGRYPDALRHCYQLERRGLASAALTFVKAGCLSCLGRPRAAHKFYRQALDQAPGMASWRSCLFFNMHASVSLSDRQTLKELQKWEVHHGVGADQRIKRKPRKADPDRSLRIGYVSPDFRLHVVRQFFEPVMSRHDAELFQIYCYSEANRPDFATHSLKGFADRWFRTWGLNDAEVAAQIERDQIDILVDLAGHTAGNRLGVFDYRLAPIQATHLGYFGSTGLTSIDYWITDNVLHPPDTREPATETIYRLPRCAFSYGIPAHTPAIAERKKSNAAVTFGCFNNVSKVGRVVADTWCEILRRQPGSRLILKDRQFAVAAVRRSWRQRLVRRGIALDRVALLPDSPHPEYLQSYNQIDIALDPFPRTGGTTTCDALLMGVPVVTLAGGRYVERLSATKLAAVGASELIAHTREDYITRALALAASPSRRLDYHQSLRQSMARSPLCDPLSLVRALEDAYRQMWIKHLAEQTSR